MSAHLTVDELRQIADVLDSWERQCDSGATHAISQGYGDNPLLGDEASEVHMAGLYRDEARKAHALRVACLRAAAFSDSENGKPAHPAPARAREGAEPCDVVDTFRGSQRCRCMKAKGHDGAHSFNPSDPRFHVPAPAPQAAPSEAGVGEAGIYIASRSRHWARWIALRESGVPIVSTWIDEGDAGATDDWTGLWDRCVGEAAHAAALVLYTEPADFPLKGAFVEVGAALAHGRPVFVVADHEFASFQRHRLVTTCATLEQALAKARAARATPAEGARRTEGGVDLDAIEARAEGTAYHHREVLRVGNAWGVNLASHDPHLIAAKLAGEDVPALVKKLREQCKAKDTRVLFNHVRSMTLTFLGETVGERHQLYYDVKDVKPLAVVRAPTSGLTAAEVRAVVAALASHAGQRKTLDGAEMGAACAAAFWALCTTGMRPAEYWQEAPARWALLEDRVRVWASKTGKGVLYRDIPCVDRAALVAPPQVRRPAFEARLLQLSQGTGMYAGKGAWPKALQPYTGRRTFRHACEMAGIPDSRAKVYRARGPANVDDLYKQMQTDAAYLADDTAKLKAWFGVADNDTPPLTLVKDGAA